MKILSKKVFLLNGVTYNIDTLSDLQVKKLTGKSREDFKMPVKEKKKKKQSLNRQKITPKKKEKTL